MLCWCSGLDGLQEVSIRKTFTSSAPRAVHLLSAIAAPSSADCTPTVMCSTLPSSKLWKNHEQFFVIKEDLDHHMKMESVGDIRVG
jgi:hypothetical protein